MVESEIITINQANEIFVNIFRGIHQSDPEFFQLLSLNF